MNLARLIDEMGPDYPECHVALIDALRDYIKCCADITESLLHERAITAEQAKQEWPHMARCKALLSEIEDLNFDPSLNGFLDTGGNMGERMA